MVKKNLLFDMFKLHFFFQIDCFIFLMSLVFVTLRLHEDKESLF